MVIDPNEPDPIRRPRPGSRMSQRGPSLFGRDDPEAAPRPIRPDEVRRIGLRVLILMGAGLLVARWGRGEIGAGLLIAAGSAVALICAVDIPFVRRETDAQRIFTSTKQQAIMYRGLGVAAGIAAICIGILRIA